jgi:hypothetical protein
MNIQDSSIKKKFISWVRPGVELILASLLWPIKQLIRLDLPTFDLPEKAIPGKWVSGYWLF